MNKNFIVKHTYFVGLGALLMLFMPQPNNIFSLQPLEIILRYRRALDFQTYDYIVLIILEHIENFISLIGLFLFIYGTYKLLIYFIKLK